MPESDPPAHAPHAPPAHLVGRDRAELEARLKVVEKDFYWSRHGRPASGGKTPQQLEREWNDLKAALAEPGDKPWVYKHDRRDAFTFRAHETLAADGSPLTVTTARGTVHDPETTIAWRTDTGVGRRRYNVLQRAARRRGELSAGDDFGHLIADQYGADPEGVNAGVLTYETRNRPARRANYTSQNETMNEHRGWRPEEARVAAAARTAPVDVEVASTATTRFGPNRERSRTLTATQEIDGRRQTLASTTVEFGNFPVAGPLQRPDAPDAAQVEAWKEKLRAKAEADAHRGASRTTPDAQKSAIRARATTPNPQPRKSPKP